MVPERRVLSFNMAYEGNAPKEFEERIIELNRVSKKTKGGSTLSFSALVAVGDRNGRIGFAHGKAKDASVAISKALGSAKKNLHLIKRREGTIAHEVFFKSGASEVFLKPAPKGTGLIAGGAVRHVLELVGIKDISAKMFGSSNKLSSVDATIKALEKLKG